MMKYIISLLFRVVAYCDCLRNGSVERSENADYVDIAV